MDERPTYLSLFSGIGGLDLAVEAHGFRCVGQVEYEPACAAVLERWWPGVPRWGDVHDFSAASYAADRLRRQDRRSVACGEAEGSPTASEWRVCSGDGSTGDDGSTASPDLIIGGYPCQPFSHAGKRGGTDDPRHLWPEFARLIREFRPRWALLENVPGHLSLGAAEVLADLAALGYDATWTTVRAADVGAPHRRERWFCLAERADTDGERRGLVRPGPLPTGDRGEPQPRAGGLGEAALDSDWVRRDERRGFEPSRLDQGRRSGAPALADKLRQQRLGTAWQWWTGPADFDWGPYEPAIRRWERVMGPAPMPVDERNRLAPAFVEWMMGFPAGWTDGMTRTQALKALGNAVVPHQGAAAIGLLSARIESEEQRRGHA